MIIKEYQKDNNIREVYGYYIYISYESFHVFPSQEDIINFLMKHILFLSCIPSHDYNSIDRYTCTSYDVKEYHEWLQTISKEYNENNRNIS